MMIEYYRIREGVVPPVRTNPSDAGLDCFFCPVDMSMDGSVRIHPGENKPLSTGLKFGIPHGYMLQVMNRSGIAVKRSLVVGAHCIDSGYDGEVFIDIHNIGTETQVITPRTKIAQLVMVPVVSFRAVESGEDNMYGWSSITISDRGSNALGSSGDNG